MINLENIFSGPDRGAGLITPNSNIKHLHRKTYTFKSADSKSVASSMPGIRKWAEAHPNDPVYK